MTDRILALHRLDLAPAAQLAEQMSAQRSGQAGRPPVVTVLDPGLATYAYAAGIQGVELLQLPGADVDAAEASARALSAARLLSGLADELMAELIPAARGASWCSFWYRTLYTTAYGNRSAAKALAKLTEGDALHLLLPELPHRYGYHSFVPGTMVFETLRAAGRSARLWVNPLPAQAPPQPPDPATAPPGAPDLLCYIPTCFSDSALFASELQASGQAVLVLPSDVFDVPTGELPRCALASSEQLLDRLEPATRQQLEAVLDRLGQLLSQHLGMLFTSAGLLHQQVQALVAGYRLNAALYFALAQRFAAQPPRCLLISNHDVGLHGALVSFARQHGLRILMVPHAKIFNSVVPSCDQDVLCLTHALQGGEVIDVDGCRMPSATLDFAKPLQLEALPPKRLAVLGIVLNAVSANSICMVDMAVYLAGLRRLVDWCSAHGIDCRVRCRPNGSILPLLVSEFGLSMDALLTHQTGSLVDFARPCDLVLGYDIPTSGMFDLLDQGMAVLQTLCRRLEPEQIRMADARVLPQLSVDASLQQLAAFAEDQMALWRYRHGQRCRFVAASAGALPLRAYL